MTQPDLNNLRQILEEYERYAEGLMASDARQAIASQIRAVVSEARAALHPSADSTANFVDTRQILERLHALRTRAETTR